MINLEKCDHVKQYVQPAGQTILFFFWRDKKVKKWKDFFSSADHTSDVARCSAAYVKEKNNVEPLHPWWHLLGNKDELHMWRILVHRTVLILLSLARKGTNVVTLLCFTANFAFFPSFFLFLLLLFLTCSPPPTTTQNDLQTFLFLSRTCSITLHVILHTRVCTLPCLSATFFLKIKNYALWTKMPYSLLSEAYGFC